MHSPYRTGHVELVSPTPAEARHPGSARWWPGRVHHWNHDGTVWRGFYWPEDAGLTEPKLPGSRMPKDAPSGWIELSDLRPAGHEIRVGRRQDAAMPYEAPAWFWPDEGDLAPATDTP